MKNIILISTLTLIIIFAGCKKESTTTTEDATIHSTALLKSYQDATTNDMRLVNFHQHAGTGSHDSCFVYIHQYSQCDSLFSIHFYEYCHTIYSNKGMVNGGQHMDEHGEWNHESGQCGLDSLEYGNWHGSGDYRNHDSLMHHQMEKYSMMGYFSSDVNQCYYNMQVLRDNHNKYHKFH